MKKQELIHLNGLMEEVADYYSEEHPDVVRQYLEEENDIDLSKDPYASVSEDQLLPTYFQETLPTTYTDIHKGKPEHKKAVSGKADALSYLSAQAMYDETEDRLLTPSAADD